ncbi:hypothetical protein [Azohydromonas caseinilytica]|uniref:PEP-CTERM protein-sorting domain-containing protein n=1 Tax=Azohydromonas caseinilytica TaxID=2728836 RepID=A0A848FBB0_9BURK|nr:hypothetical protein [Azohydromonas caseinilytica]NML16612.1 hypothetical protein [Azohydromonas caseinilytica]
MNGIRSRSAPTALKWLAAALLAAAAVSAQAGGDGVAATPADSALAAPLDAPEATLQAAPPRDGAARRAGAADTDPLPEPNALHLLALLAAGLVAAYRRKLR